MPTLSSQVTPLLVMTTSCSATRDDKVGIMTTLDFECESQVPTTLNLRKRQKAIIWTTDGLVQWYWSYNLRNFPKLQIFNFEKNKNK